MKKIKLLSLLLALPLLGGCGEHQHTFASNWSFNESIHYHAATCEHTDLKSDEGEHTFVNDICSICGYEQEHTHTFSDEWTYDEIKHWHAATCGHDVVSDEAVHNFADGICTVCGAEDPTYQVWTDAQKQIFVEHLYGFELPCRKGLSVEWDAENSCVVVYGATVTSESFNAYVDSIVAQGFSKQQGPYEDSYILLKELSFDNKLRTIDIDIFVNSGILYAICYDPFIYEWPSELIDELFDEYFYVAPTIEIPEIPAERYYVDTSYVDSKAILAIYCESETNLEETCKAALIEKGFKVSSVRDEDGFYKAYEDKQLVEVLYSYSSVDKALCFVIKPADGWPAFVVDYYTDQLTGNSGTRVPAVTGAKSYEFIDVYDRYGYFFVLCLCNSNLEKLYEEALAPHYTIYNEKTNTAGNYYAVSDKKDLLVQYKYIVTESIMGGPDYIHFDVLFEKFFPHNEEHIAAGLQLIQPGTKTTLPAYPGNGEKIDFSDTDKYMTVTIQATTFDSVATYVETLKTEGWSVKTVNPLMFNYQAISANRDIFMEISMVDGRVTLTLNGYSDPYKEWPTAGVKEILDTLGLKGEIPVFENAFGFDYENTTDYHDIICLVPFEKEQELIDAYNEKLEGLGWRKITDGEDYYYVIEGSTIGLTTYTEYTGEGKVFIDVRYADGNIYDVDARQAFIDWKVANEIDTEVVIPGLNFSAKVVNFDIVGDEGKTYPNYELFEVLLDMGDSDLETLIEEVNEQFEKDGWVFSSGDGYYHKDNCFMTSYDYLGYLTIDICAPIPDRSLLGVIKSFVSKLGVPYDSTVLPETLELTNEYKLSIAEFDTGYYFDLYIYLDFATAAKCKTSINEISAAFKALGWTLDEYSKENDVILVDPKGNLQLELYRNGNSSKQLHVEIEEAW